MEYLNSYAAVYIDGVTVGDIRFPGGEADITSACQPGKKQVLTVMVKAMPLQSLIQSFHDTNTAKETEGKVEHRGLCGDVFLLSKPKETSIADIKVDTSVQKWEISFDAEIQGISGNKACTLHARIMEGNQTVKEFESKQFTAGDIKNGRYTFSNAWKPEKLWDIHTPQNKYDVQLILRDAAGKPLDVYKRVRFGFREFWIHGRDFWLNGSRIYCFAVPLDNAQVSAAAASYTGARETMRRLKTFGVNAVYTHNYGCEPGSHLGFTEILKAADDAGMLVFFSQPHFSHYDWKAPDAATANGYARHAEFYMRQAQNHPAVVMYAMSHNATGYDEDMNPDMMDGIHDKRDTWAINNVKSALQAEEIVKRFDQSRIIYHHAGGNLGVMHTSNFYLNFTPVQERSDWFEHWAAEGIKPLFLCEYGTPWGIDWTMYRGWYQGKRDFGGAAMPWQSCPAEWNSQFLGDRAYQLTEKDRANLRFESAQAIAGKLWHRWDYPYPVVSAYSQGSANQEEVWAQYITNNWRAFRTWGLPAFNVWSFSSFWQLRDGVNKNRKDCTVHWDKLQTPGFSPDFIDGQFECIDQAYKLSDWIPTAAATALIRNNQPLLAYIAGKAEHFTGIDHNFNPGQTVEKQIIIINNSRETVTGECTWKFNLPQAQTGSERTQIETGQQVRIPLKLALPSALEPGQYKLQMTITFNNGDIQEDTFGIDVLPALAHPAGSTDTALFDPKGETASLLHSMNIPFSNVDVTSNLSGYKILIIGKAALTPDGPAPDIQSVHDGLKVLLFEQTSEVLEKRLGFRVQEYGLRQVFPRVADHPVLSGLCSDHLANWKGEATIVPPRLTYQSKPMHGPLVQWCGIEVTRPWRCGCWGNVASVLIEKPAVGDFLPITDGGFNLQYSPLLEYHEGKGMVLFCQMDVTGRTEEDPAATRLVANMLNYISSYKPLPSRNVLYTGDPAGFTYLKQSGLLVSEYNGNALTSDQILVTSPGGNIDLASCKQNIAAWLKEGGHLLAIGFDGKKSNVFLPFAITTKNAEHIDTIFESAGKDSPLAGVGPSEVLIREPHLLPLITGGATTVGNGVLAYTADSKVTFIQMAPWQFNYDKNFHRKMTFRRTSFLLTRLLANQGAGSNTPLLSRFATPVIHAGDQSSKDGRWLSGLYLDTPEEIDDPYRFFRW